MDEIAKTEARNYLSAAGFFLMAAWFLLYLFASVGSKTFVSQNASLLIAFGIGLLVIATLLIVLRKRDMIAILFFMCGFYYLFCGHTTIGMGNIILLGFLFLVALVTLVSNERIKWLLFLVPALFFVNRLIIVCFGYNTSMFVVFNAILTVLCLYYAFACASERVNLPGRKLLTADETTDFKAPGSVLGYMIFALITGGYTLYYILGEAVLPLETLATIETICGALMIFVAILLLVVGKMRFTPIMFMLMGLTSILSIYSNGLMFIAIGILFIIVGLFAMLRKESRVLPGLMLIIYGCSGFFSAYANGAMVSAPVVSVILNVIPCLIAIYLSFVVYSQRKLPKF